MVNNQIKFYKDMLRVEVGVWYTTQKLYWEGTVKEFKEKRAGDYSFFPRYNRNVFTNKIKDFWPIEMDDKDITLEMRIEHLTTTQKAEVKNILSSIKKNLNRDPSKGEITKAINIAIDPDFLKKEMEEEEKEKYKTLNDIERFKTSLVIKKQKIAKIVTGSYVFK